MVLAYTELIDSFTIASASAWTDYNIFTLKGVPKGAIVEIALCNAQTGTEQTMGVRTDGSALNRSILIHEAEGGGEVVYTMPVKVHATTGLIECYTTATANYFRILGYFTGCDFTEAMATTAISTTGAWTDHDLGANGGLVHSVVISSAKQDASATMGIRTNGSALNRYLKVHEPEAGGESGFMFYVKSDVNDVIEYWLEEGTSKSLIDLGYFDSTVNFVEAWTQINILADITWEDHDLSAYLDQDGRIANFILTSGEVGVEENIGVRTDLSGLSRYILVHESESAGGFNNQEFTGYTVSVVTLSSTGVVELYAGHFTTDYFWFSGYFKPTAAGPTPGWNKLQYLTEPPTAGAFNKLKFASEPPIAGAWNKILYSTE